MTRRVPKRVGCAGVRFWEEERARDAHQKDAEEVLEALRMDVAGLEC